MPQFIKLSVLIFDFSLLLSDLVFQSVGLIIMDFIQLCKLFGSVSFHVLDLILNQRVEFLLFGIPSDCILPKLSPELFLIVL